MAMVTEKSANSQHQLLLLKEIKRVKIERIK